MLATTRSAPSPFQVGWTLLCYLSPEPCCAVSCRKLLNAANQVIEDLPACDSLLDVAVDQKAANGIPWTLSGPR